MRNSFTSILKVVAAIAATTLICSCASDTCAEAPKPYYTKATENFKIVWERYRLPELGLFSEHYPHQTDIELNYFEGGTKKAQECSFLWPMSGIFSASVLMAKAEPETYRPYLDSMVMAMEKYYDTSRMPFGYQAYPVQFEKVDRYYDDNGLVGIDYIDTYSVTHDQHHLEKAKQVFSFIISGWDFRFEGGVPWLEGNDSQKPACSNGKAVVLAAKLYEATGDVYYLESTKMIYEWMMKWLRDPEKNIIWNSWICRKGGFLQKTGYTYNTGTVIQAAVFLYRFTGEKRYLEEADQLCAGSIAHFIKYTDQGIPFTYNIPWFDVVLFRGFHELWRENGDRKYIDVFVKALDYALEHAVDPDGLVCNDWTGRRDEMAKPKWLLDSACIPEFLVRIAEINGEIKLN